MKKAVSILVMIIMNILMISDAKACEMSYDEYKDIKMRYTGLYIEESNEYKRKVIRYASLQSENAIEETVVK